MQRVTIPAIVAGLFFTLAPAHADIVVDYVVDAGGNNSDPLNGLAARATYTLSGDQLSILLENTSAGVPVGFDTSDSLLVSLGINLPGVQFATGDAADIGPGSIGIGTWATRGPGESVGEEWLWTNDFGGDLLELYAQVISTSQGQGGGLTTRFDGGSGTVGGPFGGIAADPVLRSIPGSQHAVSDSIRFELTLSAPLTEAELRPAARASIVEYGSDQRYLRVPEPASIALVGIGVAALRRRR